MLYNTERPMNFDSVIGQKYIVESIRAQAKADKFFGVYLFGGHFGCGKTSMARILNLAANCEHLDENGNPCLKCNNCRTILSGTPDIVEIDAATNTGVDSIRDLRESVNFTPLSLKRKIYIIDEVHMLSKGAFNALLKVLEEPPSFVTFILCTTEVDAIPATIRSRCACYFFEGLTAEELVAHVENVATRNDITLLSGASNVIAKYAQGAVRNALSILDQVSSIKKEVSAEMVEKLLGVTNNDILFDFAKELLAANTIGAISLANEFAALGKDLLLLCDDLIEIITDAIIFSIGGKTSIQNTDVYLDKVSSLVSITDADKLCVLADHLQLLKSELKASPSKSTLLSTIIRITMDTEKSVVALSERIRRLETELSQLKSGKAFIRNDESASDEKFSSDSDIVNDFCEDIIEADIVDVETEKDDVVSDDRADGHVSQTEICRENVNEGYPRVPETAETEETPEPAETVKPAELESNQDFDPFDPFDVFFDTESISTPIAGQSTDEHVTSDVVQNEVPNEVHEAALLLERIATEHVIFATSLKGCSISETADGVMVNTELESIKDVIRIYLSLYEDKGFKAVRSIKL